jgi:hypothetical protein
MFAVNKSELLLDEEKERIIEDITESNEHCKENFKRFGVLTMSDEVKSVVYAITKPDKTGNIDLIELLFIISYVFPLCLAFKKIIEIRAKLNKIKQRLRSYHQKRKSIELLEITNEEEEPQKQIKKNKSEKPPKPKGKRKKVSDIFISARA